MAFRIALIGARLSTNLGGPSMFVSTKTALSSVFPDAEYKLLVPSAYVDADMRLGPKYGVEVVPFHKGKGLFLCALLRRLTGILIGPKTAKQTVRALENSDVVVCIRGILYPGSGVRTSWRRLFGRVLLGFTGGLDEAMRFAVGRILNKPMIKYTSSLGPFNLKWARIFARLYLGRFTDLILARDTQSLHEVEKLRIDTPVVQVPDTAFLLPGSESAESRRFAQLRQERPLIGLSVSYQARNRAPESVDYIGIMARFVDHLVEEYGAYVILIPNELTGGPNDDHLVAREIFEGVDDQHCEVLDTDNLLAQELKGVIGQCEVVVAARYHTIIASLSMGIPTLAIGWHHKYTGVLELFDQEDQVCNIGSLTFDDLVQKFEMLWNHRDEVRRTITDSMTDVRTHILEGARIACAILMARRYLRKRQRATRAARRADDKVRQVTTATDSRRQRD